jgi:hypothetical protein
MITTSNGEQVTPLQNVLGLRNNQLCRTQHNLFVLVHNQTKNIQLVFEPDVTDWVIQSCTLAVERLAEPLPMTLTITNYIPPITNV